MRLMHGNFHPQHAGETVEHRLCHCSSCGLYQPITPRAECAARSGNDLIVIHGVGELVRTRGFGEIELQLEVEVLNVCPTLASCCITP